MIMRIDIENWEKEFNKRFYVEKDYKNKDDEFFIYNLYPIEIKKFIKELLKRHKEYLER